YHVANTLNGRMFIFSGYGGDNYMNDVWSSSDGVNWTVNTLAAAWELRVRAQSAVHDGRLWVIGGHNQSGIYLNDVWYTTDGATWIASTLNAGWSARAYHAANAFGGRLWLMGGY